MNELEKLIEELESERNRLVGEIGVIAAVMVGRAIALGPLGIIAMRLFDADPGELQSRLDAARTVIATIEGFVARLPRIVDQGPDGIDRAITAARNMLVALGAYSPVGEGAADVVVLVRDIADDIVPVTRVGLGVVAAVALVTVLLILRR